jgi:hypothetical protein
LIWPSSDTTIVFIRWSVLHTDGEEANSRRLIDFDLGLWHDLILCVNRLRNLMINALTRYHHHDAYAYEMAVYACTRATLLQYLSRVTLYLYNLSTHISFTSNKKHGIISIFSVSMHYRVNETDV